MDAVASFSHDLPSLAATIEDQDLRTLAIKLQVRISVYNPFLEIDVIQNSETARTFGRWSTNLRYIIFSGIMNAKSTLTFQNIVGDSNRLYNPDPIDFVVIPHEEIGQSTAIDACAVAEDILLKVKEFIDQRE